MNLALCSSLNPSLPYKRYHEDGSWDWEIYPTIEKCSERDKELLHLVDYRSGRMIPNVAMPVTALMRIRMFIARFRA